MAPSQADRTAAAAHPALVHLQAALRLYADEKYELALSRFSSAAAPTSPLSAHAAYYAGVSELRLRRFEAARKRFAALKDTEGFVGEAAALGEAEAAQAMGDPGDAVEIYEELLKDKVFDAPAIWLSLANAALADGDRKQAADAFLHLYYEFPQSEHAVEAEGPLQTLAEPVAAGNTRYRLERGRGERLFASRNYPEARTSFLRLKPHASGEDGDLVALRLAEIDYFQGRYAEAREALRPYLTTGPRQAEARFFYLMAHRGSRDYASFEELVRALSTDFPQSTWAEEALNHLATYYIQIGSRRRCRRDSTRDVRSVPARALCGTGRVEGGMDGVSEGEHGRDDSVLRIGAPRRFRVRTTGRRGCIGRDGRAKPWMTARGRLRPID